MYDSVPDYTDLFNEHEARLQAQEERLPKCESCGKRITTETFFNIEGTYICPYCMDDYKVYTDEYLED